VEVEREVWSVGWEELVEELFEEVNGVVVVVEVLKGYEVEELLECSSSSEVSEEEESEDEEDDEEVEDDDDVNRQPL